ncbi:MAG: Rne/Rng family ribonuclease [Terriglobales bacterium]
MNKELYVSSTPHETRLALAENGEVAEVYFEREKEYSLAGAIYKGRVTRVLPGMQSAFVDIGLERDAFLYVSDFFEDSDEYDRVVSEAESAVARLEPGAAPAAEPSAPSEAAGEAEPSQAAGPEHEREQERPAERQRRGRRGRGGRSRSGIPEEKFARPDAASSPRQEPSRSEPADGFAPSRPEQASERSPEAMPAALTLPGESLAKYRHSRAEPAPPPRPEGRRAPPPPRAPPPAASGASAPALVLPGESLAKYRGAPAAAPPAETLPERSSLIAEAELASDEGERQQFEHERSQPDSPAPPQPPLEADAADNDDDDERDDPAATAADAAAEAFADALDSEPAPAADLDSADASAAVRADSGEARLQAGARREVRGESRGRGRRRRRGGRGPEPGRERSPEQASPARPSPRAESAEPRRNEPKSEGKNESSRLIGDLLHAGQEILIQIAKEPIGKKGARITSHLALPGRFLVYMPTVHHIGVSRRISSDEERARLKRLILENTKDLPGGFIVRTAGAGATDEEFLADIRLLANQWNDLRQQFEQVRAPALLHHDLNLVERTLRDQLSDDFTHIWVDTDEQYQRIVKFVNYFMPHLASRVRLYTRDEPLFEHFAIQEEINNALKSKVWLKSGGYIVLNQTEALVAIDVNTGKYVGRSNRLEDTIVKTNLDAIQEIVRQIRLRDLGGIIVIDFIDMDERRNRQRVLQGLEEAMRADRAPSKVLNFNDFGLVALTRKRVKQSLERTLGSGCPYCTGVGLVKSPITVCNEIYSEVKKVAPGIERDDLVLRVNPEVAKVLKSQNAQRLHEMEELTKKAISVRPDPQVHQEQFEIY